MARQSAGILLYRRQGKGLEVFLVHPGGPFWKNKDEGSWTIPKGEIMDGEDGLTAAIREFEEETGHKVKGPFHQLEIVRQKGGKAVQAWAAEGELDPGKLVSNSFEMEWPPGSGRRTSFPEVDRGAWWEIGEGMQRINPAQAALLAELQTSPIFGHGK